ncbi:hypothetical protein B0T17DRAFT_506729 [Bombardia bombarda]|uniref:Carrier domain-containing protein n=1 Tax=Bombardia bombarda TaxID=252184 RepID=A0AA40CA94_9PEZI|nr:hypothetical protein B0T17DRAFT_506729 [Bombardia bombarda]
MNEKLPVPANRHTPLGPLHGSRSLELKIGKALYEVVRRNGSLHTRYFEGEEYSQQELIDNLEFAKMVYEDLSDSQDPEGAQSASINAIKKQEIDITEGESMRVLLSNLAEGSYSLTYVFHHISFDSGSAQSFVDQIVKLYDALSVSKGKDIDPSGVDVPKVSYDTFSVWQQQLVESPEVRANIEWWQETLAGAPPASSLLPFAKNIRTPGSSSERHTVTGAIQLAHLKRMKRVVAGLNTTPFNIITAAFRAFHYRYIEDSDLTQNSRMLSVSLPIWFLCASRMTTARMPPSSSLSHALKHVTQDALEHSSAPFEKVIQVMGFDRSKSSHFPVGQIAINYQMYGKQPRLKARDFEFETSIEDLPTPCDMALEIIEDLAVDLSLKLQYDAFLYGDVEFLHASWGAIFAGEVLPVRLVRAIYDILGSRFQVYNQYGPSETGVQMTSSLVPVPSPEVESIPAGLPLANSSVYIMDPVGHVVPATVVGEFCIGGSQVSAGFLNLPDANAEGRFLPDGQIDFKGRTNGDRQIKLRGFRLNLAEIDNELYAASLHLSDSFRLVNVAVVPRETAAASSDRLTDEHRLIAFILASRTDGTPQEKQALVDNLHATVMPHLNDYMMPSGYQFVNTLSGLASGKASYKYLGGLELDLMFPRTGNSVVTISLDSSAGSEVEAILESVISSFKVVLKLARGREVAPTDSFFNLGGHSMLVLRLAAAIKRQFKVKIEVNDMFAQPTPEGIAHLIAKAKGINIGEATTSSNKDVDRRAEATLPDTQAFRPRPTHCCAPSAISDQGGAAPRSRQSHGSSNAQEIAHRGIVTSITRSSALGYLEAFAGGAKAPPLSADAAEEESEANFFLGLLGAISRTGMVPDLTEKAGIDVDIVTAEYVAAVVQRLTLSTESSVRPGAIFHVRNPRPVKLSELPQMMVADNGQALRMVPLGTWLEAVQKGNGVGSSEVFTVVLTLDDGETRR